MRFVVDRAAAVLAGVVVALIVAEVVLRLGGVNYPVFWRPHETLGMTLIANTEDWYAGEGRQYVRINSQGLRDREHSFEKPPGTYRIAVLGDSFAEAMQVALEDTFWSVMARRLHGCAGLGGRQVEVVNFGVGNYGTAQELLMLRERVWAYSPDLVLLAVLTENDIADNVSALSGNPTRPYYVHRDGELVLDDSFRRTVVERNSFLKDVYYVALRHSYLMRLVHRARGALSEFQVYRDLPLAAGGEAAPYVYNALYAPPKDPAWTEAWLVTEGLLATMHREVSARDAGFLVVTLSNYFQVDPDPTARDRLTKELGVADIFYPDRRIQEFGQHQGFSVLNLAPALQRYAVDERVHIHGFGRTLGIKHWNETGHRLAGEMIAPKVCEEIVASS